MAGDIFITDENAAYFRRIANDSGRTVNEVINEALADWIDREEWKLEIMLEAFAQAEKDAAVEHEKVVEWLESRKTDNPLPMPSPAKSKKDAG